MKSLQLTITGLLLAVFAGCVAPEQQPPAPPRVTSPKPLEPRVTAPTAATSIPSAQAGELGESSYRALFKVSGKLRGVGSETLTEMVKSLMVGFSVHHPSVQCSEEGLGSSTAISALLENRAELGPMSRYVRKVEEARYKSRMGHAPHQVRIAVDALAIFVHPENPVVKRGLTLTEIDAIFSSTRTRGATKTIRTWGDLGLTGEWANAPIRLFSRNTASGTYGFFKDNALLGGQFKVGVQELLGSSEVVTAVSGDRFSIGYSGIAFKTDSVAAVPVSDEAGSSFIPPSRETALNHTYPLTRFLFIAVNKTPGQPAPELIQEWFHYVFSPEGARRIEQSGFYPLPPVNRASEEAALR